MMPRPQPRDHSGCYGHRAYEAGAVSITKCGPDPLYLRSVESAPDLLDEQVLFASGHLGHDPGAREILHFGQPQVRHTAQLFNGRPSGFRPRAWFEAQVDEHADHLGEWVLVEASHPLKELEILNGRI